LTLQNLLLCPYILSPECLAIPALSIHSSSPKATTVPRLYNRLVGVPARKYQGPSGHSILSVPINQRNLPFQKEKTTKTYKVWRPPLHYKISHPNSIICI
jgi:hypothetical protein